MRTLVAIVVLAGVASAQVEPDFPKKVGQAIDHGVEWLKAKQLKTGDDKGSWGTGDNPTYGGGGEAADDRVGITALALFALLSCDVDPDDAVIRDGFAFLDRHLDTTWAVDQDHMDDSRIQASTYECGILLMLVEAHATARATKAMKAAKSDKRPPLALTKGEKALVAGAVQWLRAMQSRTGGWRYGEPIFEDPNGIHQDTSATQISLLGLVSAARLGEKVPPEVFLKAAQWNLETQEKDGPAAKAVAPPGSEGKSVAIREGDKARGWGYCPGSADGEETRTSGGMTASGVCSLILAKSQLVKSPLLTKDLAGRVDQAIYDGLAWLDLHWTVEENPGGARSHYYYLYALERVGVLGQIDLIGAHRWYVEGAKHLLGAQADDGHWNSDTEIEPADVIDTCFALLFLKKATLPVGSVLTR